jgi:hypothetical protein
LLNIIKADPAERSYHTAADTLDLVDWSVKAVFWNH